MKKGFVGLSENQTALFAQFWSAYPDHSAKKDAQSAFADLDPDQELVTRIALSIQERLRYEAIAAKKGEKPARWPYPATYLRSARWEDEIGSFVELRSKPTPGVQLMCDCGQPSLFSQGGKCSRCYTDSLGDNRHGPTKAEMYAAAKKRGLGKLKDETLADYAARCRANFKALQRSTLGAMAGDASRVAGTCEAADGTQADERFPGEPDAYLNAHADFAERQS